MGQPSSSLAWLASLGVALLAVFVLQTDPGVDGPFVETGRLLARATVVGVVSALLWSGLDLLRGADESTVRRLGLGVACAVSTAVVVGFLGFGNVVGTVGAAALGVGGMLVVVGVRPGGLTPDDGQVGDSADDGQVGDSADDG